MAERIRYRRILILAPPFYSHFRPLKALASALLESGAQVIVASDTAFAGELEGTGLDFRELTLNRNANSGTARLTEQGTEEKRRLEEFLSATRIGPVETLITQGRHRQADMLPDPRGLAIDLGGLLRSLNPDLVIVDQLSYGATLTLHGMQQPFATFCAPHPHSIPGPAELFSVPRRWPSCFSVPPQAEERLKATAAEIDRLFTGIFNDALQEIFSAPPVESAFALASDRHIIYNYPEFSRALHKEASGVEHIYAGHSVSEEHLSREWRERLMPRRERIMIVLGTFLASREDVLKRLLEGLSQLRPSAQIVVGAGDSVASLVGMRRRELVLERFLPQRALLPEMDLVFHHGGVGSFTETLHAAKAAVALPFSSDQFDVAVDIEEQRLGSVLDPNHFTLDDLHRALALTDSEETGNCVAIESETIGRRGPGWAAECLQYGPANPAERGYTEPRSNL